MRLNALKMAAAAVMAAGMAFAQTAPAPSTQTTPGTRTGKPGAHAGMHNRRAQARQRMMQELNLTEAQKAQAKTIFQKSWQNSQPVFSQLKANHQALAEAVKNNDKGQIQQLAAKQGNLRGQLVANHETAMAEFYQILTPEQRAKADQMRQRFESRMQQRFDRMQQQHQTGE